MDIFFSRKFRLVFSSKFLFLEFKRFCAYRLFRCVSRVQLITTIKCQSRLHSSLCEPLQITKTCALVAVNTSCTTFIAAKSRFTAQKRITATQQHDCLIRSQNLQDWRRAAVKRFTTGCLRFSLLSRRLQKAVQTDTKTPLQALNPPSSHGVDIDDKNSLELLTDWRITVNSMILHGMIYPVPFSILRCFRPSTIM